MVWSHHGWWLLRSGSGRYDRWTMLQMRGLECGASDAWSTGAAFVQQFGRRIGSREAHYPGLTGAASSHR
jgi:hypothetical protein